MRRFVPFILAMFVIAALLRVDFFFTIAYLLLAVVVLGRLWIERVVRALRAERNLPARAFFGESLAVEVTLSNPTALPLPWLQLHEALPVDLATPPFHRRVLTLGARQQRRFAYTLLCRHRGYYAIGPLKARSGDLLGATNTRPWELPAQYLTVCPRMLPLEALGLPTRSPLVALPARAPLFEDPARVGGVRDYQRGDSPRRIHWTASAAAGRLLVKQYQPAIARETLICLDLDESCYDLFQRFEATELAIVVAASLANHIAVRERLPVGLLTEARDPLVGECTRIYLPPRRERTHLVGVLDALGRVQVAPAAPLEQLLRSAGTQMRWGATLVVVTGRQSEAIFDTLALLRRAGFAVALILVQPGRPPAELRLRAHLLGVLIHRVWSERDLEVL